MTQMTQVTQKSAPRTDTDSLAGEFAAPPR